MWRAQKAARGAQRGGLPPHLGAPAHALAARASVGNLARWGLIVWVTSSGACGVRRRQQGARTRGPASTLAHAWAVSHEVRAKGAGGIGVACGTRGWGSACVHSGARMGARTVPSIGAHAHALAVRP